MPYKKPWYWEVDWLYVTVVLGGMALLSLLSLVLVRVVLAGGDVQVRWDQASDCPVVTGWELLVAPITTQNPNPQVADATVGVSIPKGTPPCGLAMQKTATVTSGVGPQRFWIRAVAGTFKSGESAPTDASMPLGKPAGLQIVVP